MRCCQVKTLLFALLLIAITATVARRAQSPAANYKASMASTELSQSSYVVRMESNWDMGAFLDEEAPAYDLSQPRP